MSVSDSYDQWQARFSQERARLLAALGAIAEGGIVEDVQHVGATSVPGVPGRPCIDIALEVWPFPLQAERQAALAALGYEPIPGFEDAPEQRFRHTTGNIQLYVVAAGDEQWMHYLLIRDYLRGDAGARRMYTARKPAEGTHTSAESTSYVQAKAGLFREMLEPASQWWIDHRGFAPVVAVAHELEAFPHPWYISSGWALDLFHGRVTRVHHDVDVVVARTHQLALHEHMTARGWKFVTPLEGRLEPWPSHMSLELPRHQAHAHRGGAFIDFLISQIECGVWHYRRDPIVIRTVDRIRLCTSEGIPFLAPELVLLFKSKNTSGKDRGKDQADFEGTYRHVEPERRAWLRWALIATDPTHPWIEQLG